MMIRRQLFSGFLQLSVRLQQLQQLHWQRSTILVLSTTGSAIAYAVYCFFTPDYLEDFEEDFDDDFDNDFFSDEDEVQ